MAQGNDGTRADTRPRGDDSRAVPPADRRGPRGRAHAGLPSSAASAWRPCWTVGGAWRIHGSYELVLLDVIMPGLGGIELLRQLRRSEVPVIVISAPNRADRVLCLDAGADDCYRNLLARRVARSCPRSSAGRTPSWRVPSEVLELGPIRLVPRTEPGATALGLTHARVRYSELLVRGGASRLAAR